MANRFSKMMSGSSRQNTLPLDDHNPASEGGNSGPGKAVQLPLVAGVAPMTLTPAATAPSTTPEPVPEPLDPRPELPGHELWETVLGNALAMFGDGMVLGNLKGQRCVETRLVQMEDGKAPYFRLEPTRRDEVAKWGETKRTYLEPIREHVMRVFEATSWGRVEMGEMPGERAQAIRGGAK